MPHQHLVSVQERVHHLMFLLSSVWFCGLSQLLKFLLSSNVTKHLLFRMTETYYCACLNASIRIALDDTIDLCDKMENEGIMSRAARQLLAAQFHVQRVRRGKSSLAGFQCVRGCERNEWNCN